MAHHQLDYIEFAAADLAAIKSFYSQVFGWKFTDYGPDYTSFNDERINGGFYKGEVRSGSILPVIYSSDLAASEAKIATAGGKISKAIYSFPGGRRFHFTDPSGNELAVWSE